MGKRNTIKTDVVRILLAVAFLMGCHAFGYAQNSDCDAKIDSLLNQHDLCEKGIQNPDSMVYYSMRALECAEDCYGMASQKYGKIFCEYVMTDYEKNRAVLTELIYPMVTQMLDPNTEWISDAYYTLGIYLNHLEETDKAIELFKRAINAKGPDGFKIASELELAKLNHKLYGEDIEHLLYALVLQCEAMALESPEKEELSFMIARALAEYHTETGELHKLSRDITYGELFFDFVSTHEVIMLLQMKYDMLLHYDHLEAVKCLDQIIELASKSKMERQTDRDWLALVFIQRGDYARTHQLNYHYATEYYLKALEINTNSIKSMNKVTLIILNRMFTLLKNTDDNDLALQLGELLLNEVLVDCHDDTIPEFVLSMVASYIANKDFDKATAIIDKYHDLLFSDGDTAMKALTYMGEIKFLQENLKDAIPIFEEILSMNPKDGIRMRVERLLAIAYHKTGDDRTNELSDNVNKTAKQIIGQHLGLISPMERRNWLDVCMEATECQLSMPENPTAIRNAAELNLFRKGLLLRTAEIINNSISAESADPDYLDNLTAMREELARLVSRGDSLAVEKQKRGIDEYEQRQASKSINHDLLHQMLNVNIKDVVCHLNEKSVAIDFVAVSHDDQNILGAFILSPINNPRYVLLAEYADSLPSDLRKTLWGKIMPEIEGCDEVYFCPDGPINDYPIEFFPVADGRLASESIKLHRVFNLCDIKPSCGIGSDIMFVGVSNHNSPLTDSQENTRGYWTDLPNVGLELECLRNHIQDSGLTILMDETATEANFKKADRTKISTLHISTHGVYRDEPTLVNSALDADSDDHNIARRILSANEQSLSALILRDGNIYWKSSVNSDSEDDLLTAEEIELMTFPNLNLTVLSACDTGLGHIDSEGVWGLQRAFRIAGTKNLICTLSKVDDYWTAQFMDAFYEEAAKGTSVYDSFHKAQKWLYRELPDNPEIWSSFILIE